MESFHTRIDNPVNKPKSKLNFYFHFKKCFPFAARKTCPVHIRKVLYYGDTLYIQESDSLLNRVDPVYQSSRHFISNVGTRTHHCDSVKLIGWTSLEIRRKIHMCLLIFKTILGGKLPVDHSEMRSPVSNSYHTWSSGWLIFSVRRVCSHLGKTAFYCHAPWAWKNLQDIHHLEMLPSCQTFRHVFKNVSWAM